MYLRRREFNRATREFNSASIIIEKHNYRREQIILLEYQGELAFEQSDLVLAKKLLIKAYNMARDLAPESGLTTQTARRLSEVELALDNYKEAMKLAQKALEISLKLGEKSEISHSKIAIAQIFLAEGNYGAALDSMREGLELIRKVGDIHDLGRALLIAADIFEKSREVGSNKIEKTFEEAFAVFIKLKLFYWSAETRFRQGVFNCRLGRIIKFNLI